MSGMTLRTKFIGGFIALLIMVVALAATSVRAISTLNTALDRVGHRISFRADRTSQIVETLVEIGGRQQAILLRSILSDTAGVEQNRRAVGDAERRLDSLFGELNQLLDAPADKQLVQELQAKVQAVRPLSEQVNQLIQKQQMSDALKIVGEKLLPSYEELERNARDFLSNQREKLGAETMATLDGAGANRILAFVFVGLTAMAALLITFAVRQMNTALNSMGSQVTDGAQQVARAAVQMGSISQSLAQGASEQAVSLEQTSASAERVNVMVQKNAKSSRDAAENTNHTSRLLSEANQKLDQMLVSMRDIYSSSERISKIIRVIDEIAFQTNILSLNAAVEAARAGEAGMGFAVVADEVRNLARRCSQAAKDTSGLIEESIQHSKVGKVRLDEVADAMRQVTERSLQVQKLSNEVYEGSDEQARAIEQISRAILQIQQVTQQTAASAEEGASAGAQMSSEADNLQSAVHRMRSMLGMQVAEHATEHERFAAKNADAQEMAWR